MPALAGANRIGGMNGSPFHDYLATLATGMPRWGRFWLVGPKCCQAWALLASLDLTFSTAAHVAGLGNVARRSPDYYTSRYGAGAALHVLQAVGNWEASLDPVNPEPLTFQKLFPALPEVILRDAAVPERIIRRYRQACRTGEETVISVVLGTKVARSVAHEHAVATALEGFAVGTFYPDLARRLALTEIDLWGALADHRQLPGWPRELIHGLAGFDTYVARVATDYGRLCSVRPQPPSPLML